MNIIHAADIHIGATFGYLGKKAPDKRNQLKATLRAIIDLAIDRKAVLVLVAGDLFDKNDVAAADVQFVRDQLIRLREIGARVCLIGGTHDFFGDFPILLSEQFLQNLPPNLVHVFAKDEPSIYFEDLGIAVAGASNDSKKSFESPLARLKPDPRAQVNFAMLHGSFQIPGKSAEHDFPFTSEQIEASGFDYIACGHWHSMQELSTAHTRAWYAGSAEPFEFNQTKSGHVLLIEVDPTQTDRAARIVRVEPIKVSETEFQTLTIDVTDKDPLTIKQEIAAKAHPKVYLSVKLKGLVSPQTGISKEFLQQEMEQKCAFITIDDSGVSFEISPEQLGQFPETMVVGAFIRNMQMDIAAEQDPARRRIKERALQKGVAVLTGKDVM